MNYNRYGEPIEGTLPDSEPKLDSKTERLITANREAAHLRGQVYQMDEQIRRDGAQIEGLHERIRSLEEESNRKDRKICENAETIDAAADEVEQLTEKLEKKNKRVKK